MKQIYFFITLLSISFIGFGQTTLVSYNFTGAAGNQATQATASVGANVIATPISRGTLATGVAFANGMGSGNWSLLNTVDLNSYFEFSVTPSAGNVLTFNQLIFAEENNRNGARNFAIRTNLDNFTTDLFIGDIPDNNNTITLRNRTIDLSSITSSNTITIRIYGYNKQNGANRSWGLKNHTTIGNMQLTGTSSPITYVYDNEWAPANPEGGVSTSVNPIQIVSGHYTFTEDVFCESLTVAPGSTMGVNNNVIIEAVNGVMLQSVSDSYAGLILDGDIEGVITYSRFVNVIGSGTTGGNDLVTPPLDNQRFELFANANSGVLAESGTLRAWAPFNNATGVYVNYDVVDNRTTRLQSGVGYRAATVSGGNLLFTGTAINSTYDAPISAATGNYGQWNAIGNPYPSYINIEAFLDHVVGSTKNIEKLASFAQAIYGYDGEATDGWDVINLANATGRLMAPGQGFFVAADNESVSLRFIPAMRTSGNSDDFIAGRNSALTFLKLKATNGSQNYTTDFYFNDNASLGFDPGYDAMLWGGDTSGFKLYSHLVENNTGIALALQTLNPNNLSGVVIPLGINSDAGTTLNFSIEDFNLPGTVEVYLEDAANNTITRIDNNDYSVTLNQTVNGTGTFFLRLTDSTLGLDDQIINSINIYHQAADEVIVITGAVLSNTPAYLYDLQGRVVSTTALNAAQLEQRIDVSGLSTGVYVLSFENGDNRISKKLVIK